jgi:hypothetical protein
VVEGGEAVDVVASSASSEGSLFAQAAMSTSLVSPVDSRTGMPMTASEWSLLMAAFLELNP